MTRSIHQEVTINCGIDELFHTLLSPSKIKKWWAATQVIVIPENGGIYALTWGSDPDKPDYVTAAVIEGIESPNTFTLVDYKYMSSSGPMPFEADFSLRFDLREVPGGTVLSVTNSGFPEEAVADEFYQGCVKGWEDTLASIANLFVL